MWCSGVVEVWGVPMWFNCVELGCCGGVGRTDVVQLCGARVLWRCGAYRCGSTVWSSGVVEVWGVPMWFNCVELGCCGGVGRTDVVQLCGARVLWRCGAYRCGSTVWCSGVVERRTVEAAVVEVFMNMILWVKLETMFVFVSVWVGVFWVGVGFLINCGCNLRV